MSQHTAGGTASRSGLSCPVCRRMPWRSKPDLSRGNGLCSDGGSSRGNMFSGDATESMLTFSTIRKSKQGRRTWLLFLPLQPLCRCPVDHSLYHHGHQGMVAGMEHRDGARINTRPQPGISPMPFMRGGLGPILHDLVTFTVISDVLRGLPAIYALYSAYDDLAHFAGMYYAGSLRRTERNRPLFCPHRECPQECPSALPYCRPVRSWANHWTTVHNSIWDAAWSSLVKDLIKEDISYSDSHKDNWDALNAVVSESTNDNTRTAGLIRRMLASRTKEGAVDIAPKDCLC